MAEKSSRIMVQAFVSSMHGQWSWRGTSSLLLIIAVYLPPAPQAILTGIAGLSYLYCQKKAVQQEVKRAAQSF